METYQKVAGALMANSHPGSYCGQDAYNDMFVTESRNVLRNATDRRVFADGCGIGFENERLQGCNRFDRGGTEMKVVRRLTPLECTRLQGYPDGWVDIGDWTDTKGKVHTENDTVKYKALGNSIALPYWKVVARRIAAQYDRDITMGSLFDGIGGFPLAFEHCGGKAIWASEIEEFPIAVTRIHFPEDDT